MSNGDNYSIVFTSDRWETIRYQTKILLTSIRLNSNSDDIHVVIPKDVSISEIPEIRKDMKTLSVHVHKKENPFNGIVKRGVRFGYKYVGLSIRTKHKKRVILDTDTLIVRDLRPDFLNNSNFALTPAHTYSFPYEKIWKKMYSFYNLKFPEIKVKAQDGTLMPPYWNTGVIFIKGCYDFLDSYLETLAELDKRFNITDRSSWLANQAVFQIAVRRYGEKVKPLPPKYNFQPTIGYFIFPSDLRLIHYTGYNRRAELYICGKMLKEVYRVLNEVEFKFDSRLPLSIYKFRYMSLFYMEKVRAHLRKLLKGS